jgi:beta-glucosidase
MTSLPQTALTYSGALQTEHGFTYRDLNHNGKLDVYEDPRQPLERRLDDLLPQLTLAEKAGLLFFPGASINPDGSIEELPAAPGMAGRSALPPLRDQHITHFNLWGIPGVQVVAKWHNNLQRYAESTRLGIPISIASDPRNHFTHTIFAMQAQDFSQWCETCGFGALDDPQLVRQFADFVRQEYLAVGIRVALHPQIDLATEPRWPRISGTFGEDAHVSARLVKAYIEGFQGAQLGPHSVACMTKHFPGGGPQNEGLDPHFPFQKGRFTPAITSIITSSPSKRRLLPGAPP